MRQFRSAKQNVRLMDVLPPEQGEKQRPTLKPAVSAEIIDAEFEIVTGKTDYRRYPTFNDNRKAGQRSHAPPAPPPVRSVARVLRQTETVLQGVSGRGFAALTISVFALVFIAIQTFNTPATQKALAVPLLEPLTIEHVDIRIKVKNGLPMLILSGSIANRTQTIAAVPDLKVTEPDGENAGDDLTIEAPVKSLGPGQSAFFEGQFRHEGSTLPKLAVDFATAGSS